MVVVAALSVSVAAATASATPNSAQHHAAGVFKVAWIYTGPHNDRGWSQAHEAGRLYVQQHLGSRVQMTYKENIQNPQIPQVVAGLVHDGYQMIFATSYGYLEGGANGQLYHKYPKVLFEQATGEQVKPNQSEYYGTGEDSIYLSGMAAGAAMKPGCNTVGYVVPFPIPEVIRHANAFTLGVQATHPGAKVRVVWTFSWYSKTKERAAAASLASAGACVLGQNVDSPATGEYAKDHNIPWVGYDSDASSTAPRQWLTAAVYNWGPYYLSRVQAAMAGKWKPGFWYGTVKNGFTGLAKFGPLVSAKTRTLIKKRERQIENGSFYEFTGPLYDQAGKLQVPKGKRVPVWDPKNPKQLSLYTMGFFVRGVEGSPTGH
jgi:basic membrane protein A